VISFEEALLEVSSRSGNALEMAVIFSAMSYVQTLPDNEVSLPRSTEVGKLRLEFPWAMTSPTR